jgi:hypothetical protein
MVKTAYWVVCLLVFVAGSAGLGYLMLFDPRRYVALMNWHFRRSGLQKRLSIEKCSRMDHRAAGLFLILFGMVMVYVSAKVL